ncbi:MAG TPA: HNH endonuclease signature motif containing protein, partial [Kofleriaceae bacterium]
MPTWAQDHDAKIERHREIDRQLRAIAKQMTVLDVEQARWLREAERHRVWRKLGFSTALEYLEDVFGHAPRTAKDRLRVAKELGELPGLEEELRNGALPYSAARELTRVMTRATEAQWLARARGRNVRDIAALVAGHKKGDTPDDPKDPALLTRDLVFTLDARRQALFEQVRAAYQQERGDYVEDTELFEAMCMRFLAGASAATEAHPGKAPQPMHQIVYRRCDTCEQASQEARGQVIPLRAEDFAQAECDAAIVREAEIVAAQANGKRRPAPTLTIPAKTRDMVWRRDHGRCRFPGCRATRNLAIHHLVHRAHGGDHDPTNLLVLCDGHHKLLHDGIVSITGRAPNDLVFARDGHRLVDPQAPAEQAAAEELQPTRAAKTR